jgi:hypothetical protein
VARAIRRLVVTTVQAVPGPIRVRVHDPGWNRVRQAVRTASRRIPGTCAFDVGDAANDNGTFV